LKEIGNIVKKDKLIIEEMMISKILNQAVITHLTARGYEPENRPLLSGDSPID